MKVDLSSNVREVISAVDLLFNKQVPFAVAKALTDTARLVAEALPSALQQDLDRPTAFTTRGFYVTPARKDQTPVKAVVGVKDKQAQYLGFQIEGGERKPTRVALRLPTSVDLDQFGNVPSGLIRQLIARAKAGRRATKTQARRFGVSQELDLFYGEPGDGRPAGIYKRVGTAARHQLVPLIVMPKRSATYRPRFDFTGHALRVVERQFEQQLDAALAHAMETAR